ncbi:transposase [Thiomicrospira sp. R3]|uniref:transposase n=1 Tax=Thiomicrospira sp. R3 TaxID=3035472 RepID=UPI00259B5236|nr:transposase [Thiomicrospira sp. R3]WFE68369.1 transposase [Thiomicrospira sp. R3]
MTIKHPKRYDDQLKQQAIEMALEGSKTIAQIARDLDIKDNTLYGWVDKYRRANKEKSAIQPAMTKPIDLEAENRRLKRELKTALEDVELLKKSGGVLCGSQLAKYAWIDTHKADYSVCRLCRLIGIKRSSYTSHLIQVEKYFARTCH